MPYSQVKNAVSRVCANLTQLQTIIQQLQQREQINFQTTQRKQQQESTNVQLIQQLNQIVRNCQMELGQLSVSGPQIQPQQPQPPQSQPWGLQPQPPQQQSWNPQQQAQQSFSPSTPGPSCSAGGMVSPPSYGIQPYSQFGHPQYPQQAYGSQSPSWGAPQQSSYGGQQFSASAAGYPIAYGPPPYSNPMVQPQQQGIFQQPCGPESKPPLLQ
ncbi:hypothetical protein [Pasteuria penetrans]|uniref:hypothetical protein n=1 Tax=Pasteuria penetrans TaxID=86005 RepID=UPI000FB214E7|nr:hypothetical protein [Pasteuria penetrans]